MVELIAVGSELVTLGRADTNSDWIAGRLQTAGFDVTIRSAVDDDVERIAALVAGARRRSPIVLLTGGLGPTEDDRTREAVARALGVPLEDDSDEAARLRTLYERHGRYAGPTELRQARRPAGCAWLDNPRGSAAGLLLEGEGKLLAALPGVPAEMRAMFDGGVLPRLAPLCPGATGRLTLRLAGRSESSLDRAIHDLYATPGLEVTTLGGVEGVEVHARVRGTDAADCARRLSAFETELRARVGADVYGGAEDDLASVVGRLLARAGKTLAVAESCTGGLLGSVVTRVPGSSEWFRGGFIVYANDLKQSLAGVDPQSLAEHGAVSESVARELAHGARARCGADVGIGITGVAGPGGGSAERPVGSVHVVIEDDDGAVHDALRLIGDRQTIRRRTVTLALDRLRRRLSDGE